MNLSVFCMLSMKSMEDIGSVDGGNIKLLNL